MEIGSDEIRNTRAISISGAYAIQHFDDLINRRKEHITIQTIC